LLAGGGQAKVFIDRKAVVDTRHLSLNRQTSPSDAKALLTSDVSAAKQDLTTTRPQLSGKHFEKSTFTSAVRTYHTTQLTL
jgi:hypothetical protein